MKSLFKIFILLLRGRPHEARRYWMKLILAVIKRYYSLTTHEGVGIMAEDWDYLVILDACRYDFFEAAYKTYLAGSLEKKITRGTSTSQWLQRNFIEHYGDTVYVSANPHCSDYTIHGFRGTDHFFKVEHVWKHSWNEKLDTVEPSVMTDAALRLAKEHPDKRQIIHYIQPHGPWIGKTRISVDEIGTDSSHPSAIDGKWTVDSQVWELVRQGRFDIRRLIQADKDNLDLVLGEVRRLVAGLHGKIIITADHGEAFGEKFVVGHPFGVYIRELAQVPWLVIEKGARIQKRSGTSQVNESATKAASEDEMLTQRLRALGYMG